MTYTITTNAEHNGIEITFTAKPSEAVREALKALNFRWHGVKKLWYGRATAETVKSAIEGAENGKTTPAEPKQPAARVNKPDQDRIRIYWNGIKLDGGKLRRCGYSLDDNAQTVTIYARDYNDLPRDLLPVVNESDIYTDYFENDRATITPAHPLYKYFRFAALKEKDHDDRAYIRYCDTKLNKPERWRGDHEFIRGEKAQREDRIAKRDLSNDPGQPTAADLAEINRQAQEAENKRRAEEHAADLARREQFLNDRCNGRRLISGESAAHPLEDNAPRVIIRWSEHPAFTDWEDNTLMLSLEAAENILHKLDEEQHEREEGYYKTAFALEWTDENGETRTYTGRYDLGNGDGGLIAHIRSFIDWSLSRTSSTNPDDIETREEAERILKMLESINA